MSEQPKGAPPTEWAQRDDSPEGRARRKLFQKLAAVEDHVEHIELKLEERVTWQRLTVIIGAVALAAAGAFAWTQSRSDTQNAAAQKVMADQVAQLRAEIGGVYKHLIEGQSKARVAAEVREVKEQHNEGGGDGIRSIRK